MFQDASPGRTWTAGECGGQSFKPTSFCLKPMPLWDINGFAPHSPRSVRSFGQLCPEIAATSSYPGMANGHRGEFQVSVASRLVSATSLCGSVLPFLPQRFLPQQPADLL